LARAFAEQKVDLILGLCDRLLDARNGLSRGVHELFGLAKIEQGRHAPLLPRPRQFQRLFASAECAFRDLKNVVELTQRQIGGRDITNEGGHDSFPVFLCAEQRRSRGFGGPAQPAPDVDLKRQQRQEGRSKISILIWQHCGRQGRGAVARQAIDLDVTTNSETRKLC
jgi:hypothetical protein